MRYVALLRGINVGGHNIIKMTDLKAAFEESGYDEVSTYIQSGNVLFTAPKTPNAKLEKTIETALSKRFGYEARVLVRSEAQVKKVLADVPKGWPNPDTRCNIIFLKPPLTPANAEAATQPKDGIDTIARGTGVLYFGTRKDALAKSGLPKFVGTKEYKLTTVRTYGTVAKILDKLAG